MAAALCLSPCDWRCCLGVPPRIQGAITAAGFMERWEQLVPTKAVAIAALCFKNGFLTKSRYLMCAIRVKCSIKQLI